ncbi:PHD-zinc-finger like domain-containing protein [Armillaria borealis]|uniref:PHD-zinc-finger like domain-containing protein n=1 Tax=Armillaria borealis TaxID=47425 RepID=A0AA39MX93_9AGAR|nr:PHD-zinc-finger like domain-containing protein [Armillaria borealis]
MQPPPLVLPVAEFEKVEESSKVNNGVHDNQMKAYGFNDLSNYQRPDHYVRHIEPLELDLATQVEYDMDEQDEEWLIAVNADRKKMQVDTVSYETFEIIMDRLEKEWYNLTKNIPKPHFDMPSEDSTCAICDDAEGENSNAIVFCDGCNLAVHQECYGVPYIPEGIWLCRKCSTSPETPVECFLCPNEGGAFKMTDHGQWVHLLCAMWIPEMTVQNEVYMDPTIAFEDKLMERMKRLKCSVCKIRTGACIQCAIKSCYTPFHVTCGRKEKFLLPMKNLQGSEPVGTLKCFCDKHLIPAQKAAREAAKTEDEQSVEKISNTARAHAKAFQTGAPLVPWIIVDRIAQYIGRINVRKKVEFIILVCKYWSLKREARRGAPLLKRLHLEAWPSSTRNQSQTTAEKIQKKTMLKRLRKDLDYVKRLSVKSYKREMRKLDQLHLIQDVLSKFIFPNEPRLRSAFERITGVDKNGYFQNPVSKLKVPDYFDIIKRPMCWNIIEGKLDRHEYWDFQAFKDDIHLVCNNAIAYNKAGSSYSNTAKRILNAAEPIFTELQEQCLPQSSEYTPAEGAMEVGDLETPLPMLELLLSKEAMQDDVKYIINEDPLSSLFNYELGQIKPPPEEMMPATMKRKRDRKAENARREARRAEQAAANAGSRAPKRIRRATSNTTDNELDEQGQGQEGSDDLPKATSSTSVLQYLPSGQMSTPLLVDSVGHRDSFLMFEAGWILPEGQKRGGRSSTLTATQPTPVPPKKCMFCISCRAKSSLGVFSTGESENLTLSVESNILPQDLPATPTEHVEEEVLAENLSDDDAEATIVPEDVPIIEATNDVKPEDTAKDGDETSEDEQELIRKRIEEARQVRDRHGRTVDDLKMMPNYNVIEDQDRGGFIVEEIVTPTSRRAKNKQRKSLNEGPPPFDRTLGNINLKPGEKLERTYPWWPAVIYDEDHPELPEKILNRKKEFVAKHKKGKRSKDNVHFYTVNFFDKEKSWQFVTVEHLKMLGEHKELDEDMISPTSRRQNWRNRTKLLRECQVAYQCVLIFS